MAGVFLSYSHADRGLAEQVVRGLRRIGVEVWWDQDMPGVDWRQELERQLGSMTALIVRGPSAPPTASSSEMKRGWVSSRQSWSTCWWA
jgi:hypothetical protein